MKEKKETNKNRYFIVNYFYNSENRPGIGSEAIYTNGCYVNKKNFIESIESKFKYGNISIISISELNENDYNDFIK